MSMRFRTRPKRLRGAVSSNDGQSRITSESLERDKTLKKVPIIDVHRCTKVLQSPESWAVQRDNLNEDEDVWLQLWDGRVTTTSKALQACRKFRLLRENECLCGIRLSFLQASTPAEQMCSFTNGSVKMGFCDNAQGEVMNLLDVLGLVTKGSEVSHATTRQGRRLPSARDRAERSGMVQSPLFRRHLGQSAAKRRRTEDVMHSAVYHWRHKCVTKAFNYWRIVHEENKLLREGGAGSLSAGDGRGAKTMTTQVGLRNLGNTCYLNAALQALIAVQSFRELFLFILSKEDLKSVEAQIEERAASSSSRSSRHPIMMEKDCDSSNDSGDISLTREMYLLMHVVLSRKLVRYTPDGILRIVWKLFEEFANPRQHDAAEILIHLLDQLEKEKQSTVKALFKGKMTQRIEYTKGNKGSVSATELPFFSPWTIEVPKKYHTGGRQKKNPVICTLEECLRNATAPEHLSGDNQYKLEDGTFVDATKRFLLYEHPQVLILHINRTSWMENGLKKIQVHVEFPLEDLSMKSYSLKEDEAIYQLRSVVAHHGQHMSRGHFTCFGRGAKGGEWMHFNDAQVTPVTEEEVCAAQPYILIYERL